MNRLKISWGTNRQSELRGVVSHPCVSRPGRRLDQVRGDHQLPRIIKPRSRRKSTCNYHQVDALSCCKNHRVRIECALIIIPFCRYKWNAIKLEYWMSIFEESCASQALLISLVFVDVKRDWTNIYNVTMRILSTKPAATRIYIAFCCIFNECPESIALHI